MIIETSFPLLDDILEEWKGIIGKDYEGYRNHICRMINFCFALQDCGHEEREKLIIAGAFHDIGIWIENTVNYIPPSLPPAQTYLKSRGVEQWADEITLMISEHHKITEYKDHKYPLVELFRKGDLVDFSFGLFRFGLPNSYIKQVKEQFPNAGFHANLMRLAGEWIPQHPFNPAPMMKW